ncbi:LIC_10572 family protein [Leptospira mayottensis]|uniref:DUF1566 domain-containing protein n=2 Tax=Leptospira mayottensis TaxID=1137606 RepID=A0AA87MMH6_9LEPT|nr:hypothetical protein [Leptospira mayottensis]AXR60142.1 hypothetical protein DQM68_04895 [Leptospira mayottensis]AXR63609.1 hypothetical protein DQM28_04590 [Leptospira mayottensis]AXR67696.1 hypothetical protein DPV73_06400 [Leptospira mayottensis]AZQ03437.1 hypothetical protein LEP1GSC190_16855 [Leptospira mayottensis 200901116]EKR99786.1 hypothetical protein LEP1GSC125_0164 [Leptospira mayottensis 200901122]
MANKRRPPRKKHNSNQKGPGGNRENTDSNRGGNEQREGNRKYSHQQRQQQGKNFQRNQEFHRKSRELAMEKNFAPKVRAPQEGGKLVVRVILIISILLLGIFSYFICENYHTKIPVYGKRGWDDTFHRSATWAEAREICEEKGKRLPGKDQLKTFSKRAEQKLRSVGIFWSSSQDGETGYYFSVNFKDGSEISSPGTMKYNVICVK